LLIECTVLCLTKLRAAGLHHHTAVAARLLMQLLRSAYCTQMFQQLNGSTFSPYTMHLLVVPQTSSCCCLLMLPAADGPQRPQLSGAAADARVGGRPGQQPHTHARLTQCGGVKAAAVSMAPTPMRCEQLSAGVSSCQQHTPIMQRRQACCTWQLALRGEFSSCQQRLQHGVRASSCIASLVCGACSCSFMFC
jgi:hypothetical protein